MANVLWPKFKELVLGAGGNLSSGNVKAMLVTAGYTYSATDQYISAIVSGNRVATSANLTTKSITNGIFNADPVTFSAVPAGTAAKAVVLYVDTGTESTSPLIAYIDTATGLPDTPNGGDITVTWDTSTNKIFAL